MLPEELPFPPVLLLPEFRDPRALEELVDQLLDVGRDLRQGLEGCGARLVQFELGTGQGIVRRVLARPLLQDLILVALAEALLDDRALDDALVEFQFGDQPALEDLGQADERREWRLFPVCRALRKPKGKKRPWREESMEPDE